MTTIPIRGEVTGQGTIRIEVPCDLPAGPVEGVLVLQPVNGVTGVHEPKWEQLYGLGKEIWQGVDVEQYLREMREDREIVR
jgi:hypothetical protein